MPFGWEGAKVRLAPIDKQRHLDNCLRWFNNPEVTRWLLHGDFPLCYASEEAWFDRAANTERQVEFAIESLAGEHVGMIGLLNVDYRHGVANVGIVIGDPRKWRLGYGTDALQTLVQYASNALGLRLLLAEVMKGNDASERIFRNVGFSECGCTPQRYWKRGAFRDSIQFALLNADWRQPSRPTR